ncbi:MAG TPA: hypothetical protein VLE74_01610 [Candidatus Saccharimonadales bacterium]|nr:hypothetical protein [Candidatus Saccharimonadales bacterium]
MAKRKTKPSQLKRFPKLTPLHLATMLVVIAVIGGGLYYRSLKSKSHAASGYNVQGYRLHNGTSPFPSGSCGLTTIVGMQSTSANPFNLGAFTGNVQISSSNPVICNGITYNLVNSTLCYNSTVRDGSSICSNGNGSSTSSSNPRSPADPSTLPGGPPYYIDIHFYYQAAKPTASISASAGTVNQNGALTINWSSTNATSCSASGTWSGTKATSGSENRSGDTATTGTKTYTINCGGEGGNATAQTSVTVNATPTSPPPSGGGGGTGGGSTSPPSGGSSGSSTPASGGTTTTTTSTPSSAAAKKTNPQSSVASTPIQGATNSNTDTTQPVSDNSQPAVTAFDAGSPFEPSGSETLANSQTKKHGSIWFTILKVFLVIVLLLGAIGAGLYFFVRFRTRKQLENTYDDYWHKMNGI